MLRISTDTSMDGSTLLRMEGRVIGPWVAEMRRSCEQVLASGCRLMLDLSEVSFVDRDGIALFQHLRGRQVHFINCSPFLTEQLKQASY